MTRQRAYFSLALLEYCIQDGDKIGNIAVAPTYSGTMQDAFSDSNHLAIALDYVQTKVAAEKIEAVTYQALIEKYTMANETFEVGAELITFDTETGFDFSAPPVGGGSISPTTFLGDDVASVRIAAVGTLLFGLQNTPLMLGDITSIEVVGDKRIISTDGAGFTVATNGSTLLDSIKTQTSTELLFKPFEIGKTTEVLINQPATQPPQPIEPYKVIILNLGDTLSIDLSTNWIGVESFLITRLPSWMTQVGTTGVVDVTDAIWGGRTSDNTIGTGVWIINVQATSGGLSTSTKIWVYLRK